MTQRIVTVRLSPNRTVEMRVTRTRDWFKDHQAALDATENYPKRA